MLSCLRQKSIGDLTFAPEAKKMDTRQSIVHVSHYGNPVAGSFIQMMCALGDRLTREHHRFTLVSSAAPGATWVDQVRKAGLDVRVVRDAADAARTVKALRADIVHCHFVGFEVATTIALAPSPARIFWHVHSSRPPGRPLVPYLKSLVKHRVLGIRTESFLAISDALAAELVHWGVPPKKLQVVRIAIDTQRLRSPTVDERSDLRHSYAIDDSERVVLFFGRDPYIKGADYLTAALKKAPSLTVIAVGLDTQTLAGLRQVCRRVISIERTDNVRELCWIADRLVMPSRWEGMGFTLLESLSCGLPALTSNLACFKEVGPEMPGLVCIDVENIEDFSAHLSRTDQTRFPSQNSLLAKEWSLEKFTNVVEDLYARTA